MPEALDSASLSSSNYMSYFLSELSSSGSAGNSADLTAGAASPGGDATSLAAIFARLTMVVVNASNQGTKLQQIATNMVQAQHAFETQMEEIQKSIEDAERAHKADCIQKVIMAVTVAFAAILDIVTLGIATPLTAAITAAAITVAVLTEVLSATNVLNKIPELGYALMALTVALTGGAALAGRAVGEGVGAAVKAAEEAAEQAAQGGSKAVAAGTSKPGQAGRVAEDTRSARAADEAEDAAREISPEVLRAEQELLQKNIVRNGLSAVGDDIKRLAEKLAEAAQNAGSDSTDIAAAKSLQANLKSPSVTAPFAKVKQWLTAHEEGFYIASGAITSAGTMMSGGAGVAKGIIEMKAAGHEKAANVAAAEVDEINMMIKKLFDLLKTDSQVDESSSKSFNDWLSGQRSVAEDVTERS